MREANDLDQQKLLLDWERLKLERQKLAIEVALKRRELSSRSGSPIKDLLTNPLILAVVGGFITLMSGIITTTYTAANARQAARDTLQADLIKKFVEGPSRAAVRDNLKFLVEAGLLPTYADDISAYLKTNPDAAPQVSFTGGIVGSDDAFQIDKLPTSDPLKNVGRSVGQLSVVGKDGQVYVCTGFVLTPNLIATAGHCISPDDNKRTFTVDGVEIAVSGIEKQVRSTKEDIPLNEHPPNFALLRLDSTTQSPGLKLSPKAPVVGDALSIVMFRGSSTQFGVRSVDCSIRLVMAETFDHLCDTGAGTSGAPILSALSGEVVGIHSGRTESGAWATRADALGR